MLRAHRCARRSEKVQSALGYVYCKRPGGLVGRVVPGVGRAGRRARTNRRRAARRGRRRGEIRARFRISRLIQCLITIKSFK